MTYLGKERLRAALLLFLWPFRRLRCGWEILWGRPHLGLVVIGDGRKEVPEDAEGTTCCRKCGRGFWYLHEAERVERLLVDLRSTKVPTKPAEMWLAWWASKPESRERHPELHRRVVMVLESRRIASPP